MIIHNPILTGSLVFNGTNLTTSNLVTTGSNNFTGSQAISGSLNVTGNITATTLVVQTVSSSVIYSSGSNVFGNNIANTQVMTGSVTVTGSLAVVTNGTELQVTSTGVNLGNILTDTHNVTGSLRVNSSGFFVSSSGVIGMGTVAPLTKLQLIEVGGPSVVPTLTLSQDGDLGLDWVAGAVNFYSYDGSANSRGGIGHIRVAAETAYNTGATPSYMAFYTHPNSANNNTVLGAATEKMRITAAGNVFINNPSGISLNGLVNNLSVSSTTYNLFDISRFSDNAFGPNFYFVKSRNASIGGNTIVSNGDNLGNIAWFGANGTGFTEAATIKAEVDGTPGASNDMPGRLVFTTTADGAGSGTERMRITSTGNVYIGTAVGDGYRLQIVGSSQAAATFSQTFAGVAAYSQWINSSGVFVMGLDGAAGTTERLRITSGGDVEFNRSNATAYFYINQATGADGGILLRRNNNNRYQFALGTNDVFNIYNYAAGFENLRIASSGNIQINGPSLAAGDPATYALRLGQSGNSNLAISMNSSAAYIQSFASTPLWLNQQGNSVSANGSAGFGVVTTTSSDIRIKKNIVSIESALDKVNALRGVYYEFDENNELNISVPHGKTRVGLIAQEVETIIPEAVLDGDNESTPKSVDYTGLVGVLVKAIQELKAEIEILKTK